MKNNIKALGLIIKNYGAIDYKTKDEVVNLVELATSKPLNALIKVTHQLQFWLSIGETFTNAYGVTIRGLSESSRDVIDKAYDTIKKEPLNNEALSASDAQALLEAVYEIPSVEKTMQLKYDRLRAEEARLHDEALLARQIGKEKRK